MKHEAKESTQQKIIRILRTRGPKRLSELAPILRKSPSTIKYHLESLSDRGIVVANQMKLYRVAEERDIEKAILEAIVKYGKQKKSDLLSLEELTAFGEQVSEAFQNLVTKGLIVERDEMIELTRWGTNKLGVCHVCYKPVTGLSVANFVTEFMVRRYEGGFSWSPEIITDVLIHPKCFRKIANQLIGEWSDTFIPDECFCDYCGLPFGVGFYRMLVENTEYASLDELGIHMLGFEIEVVRKKKLTFSSMGRRSIEELVAEFEKEAKRMKLNYDSARREQELYSAYLEIIKEKKERMEGIIRAFHSPIEIAYSSVAAAAMETVVTTELNREGRPDTFEYVPEKGEYTIVFIGKDGKRLHPFCASILRCDMKAAQTPQGEPVLEQKASPYGGAGK